MKPRPTAGYKGSSKAHSTKSSVPASQYLLHALAQVLAEAFSRGIDLSASYLHFDRRHDGLVGIEEFMAAMVELRIAPSQSWDEHDAEECVLAISSERSSIYFTRDDFIRFFQRMQVGQVSNESVCVAIKKKAKQNQKLRKFNLSQPAKQSVPGQPCQATEHLSSLSRPNPRDETQGWSSIDKGNSPSISLPSWAHNRSKRALKELENMQRKRPHHIMAGLSTQIESAHEFRDLPSSRDRLNPQDENDAANNQRNLLDLECVDHNDSHLVVSSESQWPVYQLDDETSISYAILTHNDCDTPPTIQTDRMYQEKLTREGSEQRHTFVSCRFTIFLDSFQRLNTLASFFRPWLVHFPRSKILLCGFPVKTNRKRLWNNEKLAAAYSKLLEHLMLTTREWLIQPKTGIGAMPHYLVGIGTGGNVALQFMTVEIPLRSQTHPILDRFARSLRGLVLLNGLVGIDDHMRHEFLKFKRVINGGIPSEAHESLLTCLFSNFYTTQVVSSRQKAMEVFFESRKGFLQGSNLDLLRTLLQGVTKNKPVSEAIGNLSALVTAPFSVVVVHGTQNHLVPASQVDKLIQSLPDTELSADLQSCLSCDLTRQKPQLHLSWLKCGHEVFQERFSFCYDLFRQLAMAEIIPIATASDAPTQDPLQSVSSITPVVQVPSLAFSIVKGSAEESMTEELPRNADTDSMPVKTFSDRVAQLYAEHGIKWIQQELYDRELDGSGATEILLERYQQALYVEEERDKTKQDHVAAQLSKYEELEAARRDLQRQVIERQIQEKQTLLSIQRREAEEQKTFFAQMELQKELQAHLIQERAEMELEDAYSRKYREQAWEDENRSERNSDMTKQVQEIEAERAESEREAFQIELQQQRLALQQSKRDALKKFQRDFEQNELVSSAVELYYLDASPVFEYFDQLTEGGHNVAKDLTHFYELKTCQKLESVVKRQELDGLTSILASKELELRNLERVLVKAKSTGMIAKAGLGTVRIVPITQAEMQSLMIDLDLKHDEVAKLQSEVKLQTQDLAWKDQLLQRLSVLIKRNEGFCEEMIQRLALAAERGNDLVLSAREDGEKLFEDFEKTTKSYELLIARLQLFQDEMRRAEASSTVYFDTRLRVEGSLQRVHRSVFLRELALDIDTLSSKAATLLGHRDDLKAAIAGNKEELTNFGAKTHALGTSLAALKQAAATKDKSNEGLLSRDVNVVANISPFGVSETEDGLNIAERVRSKTHNYRSAEEKQWVILDFQVNFAHYYKHIDPAEVDTIEKHPDYQHRSIQKEQIQRLMNLPARNCLALAFLKTSEELAAHYLLRKYSFGDGEEYFAREDHEFALAGHQAASVVGSLAEMASALEQLYASGDISSRRRAVILDEKPAPVTLLSDVQCQILPHHSRSHSFRLPEIDTGVAVLSLTVSIVFQGHFRSVGYQNGRIAGMLYVLPSNLPMSSDSVTPIQGLQRPIAIGRCFYEHDIALCTPHSLGKLVIRHDPQTKPLSAHATYQVVIGAPVLTIYSIEITAKTAIFAEDALKAKRLDSLKKQELFPIKKDEIHNVFVTIELSERKKRLARKIANEIKDKARDAELQMIRHSKDLEKDNALPMLRHDERLQLHAAIRDNETQFRQNCFRFAKREEEVKDIEACLKELTGFHADWLEECDSMEKDLVEYRQHLPKIAALIVGGSDTTIMDAAGSKIARELNVEYACIGARSSKVLWAELSAMKAKLPSMMTPAERLRRKYKKGQETLEKKEREWILIDRILHPRMYDWEERLVKNGNYRMMLHGTSSRLTKDEEQLAVLSQLEIERILKAPWNLLERKEIQVRKIFTRFRDDSPATKQKKNEAPTNMAAFLRSQKSTDLTTEEREWRRYDQLLNPVYYPLNMKKLAEDLHAIATGGEAAKRELLADTKIPSTLTREDLVAAINTPEEELYQLSSDLLRARNLLLRLDPQLSVNMVEAARMKHSQETKYEKVEMDIDARCRLVYQELQRAIANTRNEFMDSQTLHSTLQRFPTKVLRLELEKELDRLLISQITEKEEYELQTFLQGGKSDKKLHNEPKLSRATQADDIVSDSDSDEEAQLARELKLREAVKNGSKSTKVRGKSLKLKSLQKQRREIKDVRVYLIIMIAECLSETLTNVGSSRSKSGGEATAFARAGAWSWWLHGLSYESLRVEAIPAGVLCNHRTSNRDFTGRVRACQTMSRPHDCVESLYGGCQIR